MEFEQMQIKYEKLKTQFDLFKKITETHQDSCLKVDLSKIEQMVYEEVPNTLGSYAPPNFPKLYFDFKYEYERLREFILYEHLIGKKIVALGGGFSSGKSSFLNAMMGKLMLPANIDPSTSVCTYIVQSKSPSAYGINVFNAKIDLEMSDMRVISHGFGEVTDEKEQIISEEAPLAHLLKNIFLATPYEPYEHIAFLDTPGYSKPGIASYTVQTDAKIAKAHLSTSDYILWFVPVDTGTITEADINFLSSLNKQIPKLIIVSKVDKCPREETEKVIEEIKRILALRGISYVDVLAFSRTKSKSFDEDKLRSYLEALNVSTKVATFAGHFSELFIKCHQYYDRLIEDESRRLNRLNTAITFADHENVLEAMQSLTQEIKQNIRKLKEINKALKHLQSSFWAELNQIVKEVGLVLPEPNRDNKQMSGDLLGIVMRYKQKQGIKQEPNIRAIIWDMIGEVTPHYDELAGGKMYSKTLEQTLTKNLNTLTTHYCFNNNTNGQDLLMSKIQEVVSEQKNIHKKEAQKVLGDVMIQYLGVQEDDNE